MIFTLPLYIIYIEEGGKNMYMVFKKLCNVIFSKKFILEVLQDIFEFFIILTLWTAFLYLIFLIVTLQPLKL